EQEAEDALETLRERIRRLDLELVAKAAERIDLARRIGESKRRQRLGTVDYAQERAVLLRAREAALAQGIDPRVAEDLLASLIRASVSAQDEDRLRVEAAGAGKTAVLFGGAGRMGRWMGRFLAAQGYTVGSVDPAAPAEAWAGQHVATADLVLCATPPSATADLYREWTSHPPAGVVADISSIKGPILDPIRELQRAGGHVASMHPMFGPSIVLLRDADVVICDTGDAEATRTVESLFEPTTARLVRVPLEEHDRIMADLLSLAHATAIAFALALPESEHPVRSTTFQALESLAARVVRESPDVYYEIQAKNAYSKAALLRLRAALERLVSAVSANDAAGFRDLLEEGRRRTPEI
ncbi:MAG TPA: prephenate dehydrogenase/arogenate dehydrogenase family protein, partial [Candidatus Eisenbacteria bacterium]|nr:prephenate dehydrogenase/arogenate dehydrogenase family protein [Candidatus Eisenbacteria bacterium]